MDTFSDEELKTYEKEGVHVIGMIHDKKEETKDNQFPKGIYDYWNAYEARKANKRTTPKNLIDYFRKGIEEFQNNGEKSEQIEWICKGLRRLVNKAKECNYIPATGNSINAIMKLLSDEQKKDFRKLLMLLADFGNLISKEDWKPIEILYRCERADDGYPRVIGLNLPKISDEYMRSPIIREQFVDYICNELNECLYYDMLSGGDILNGEVLPPRVGLRTGIRAIYEFVEDKEELFLQFVPGRVFSEYQIPSEAYNCIKLYKDDIYEILFGNANCIDNLCKRSLVNICESEYVRDWTQRISYLFDTFDGIDPRNYNKEKVIKLVFTILAIDKADYLRNKQKYEQLKNKYRNPILHGGKSIFEIEPDINEIKKVDTYLRKTIMDYCLKIHSLSISTWEELDNAYRVQQNFLKL